MIKVTVEIPESEYCMNDMKPCIFARFTRKWDAYNCTLHHRILKGGKFPRKCNQCLEKSGKAEQTNEELSENARTKP